MNVSYEEAIKRGWLKPEDAPQLKRATGARKSEVEGQEQAQLVRAFRERYPIEGPLLIHIPNGGSRKNAFEGWRLKEQGVRAGVSDLLLPLAKGGFFGLWIEFKAAPPNDAAVAASQLEWLNDMRAQGYKAEVCLGVQAALKVLDDYLQLPNTQPK